MFTKSLPVCNDVYNRFIEDPTVLTPEAVAAMLDEILSVYPAPGTRSAMICRVKNAFRRLIPYTGDRADCIGKTYYEINRQKRNSEHHPILGALRLPAADKDILVIQSIQARERRRGANKLLMPPCAILDTVRTWIRGPVTGFNVETAKVVFALGAVSGLRAREILCSACIECVDDNTIRHHGHVGDYGKDCNADRVIETLVPTAVFIEALGRLRAFVEGTGLGVKYVSSRLASRLRDSGELVGMFEDIRETGKLPRQCYPILFIDCKGLEADDASFPLVAQRLLGHASPVTSLHYQRFS